jgi:hypothetical protein
MMIKTAALYLQPAVMQLSSKSVFIRMRIILSSAHTEWGYIIFGAYYDRELFIIMNTKCSRWSTLKA